MFEFVVVQPFGSHIVGEVLSSDDEGALASPHCVVRRAKAEPIAPEP